MHNQDEDCKGCIIDGVCVVCNVEHGDPCCDCGGTGYHKEGCQHSDKTWEFLEKTISRFNNKSLNLLEGYMLSRRNALEKFWFPYN